MNEHQGPDEKSPTAEPPPCRVWDSRELFAGDREIWIEHAGVRYVLRLTRRDRLILTK